ncbi:MAG: molybdate ABC transporter substrate-binding protein [Pseudomonadales bacterium]|nr:molybdate ABC transporter substrate-binding protein [Pseudomonadales bacterium]MDG1444190.1 molybdate ABC transporter substrate-binding protein [Pseudomonadales bacterium]
MRPDPAMSHVLTIANTAFYAAAIRASKIFASTIFTAKKVAGRCGLYACCLLIALLFLNSAKAADTTRLTIATASNFKETLDQIVVAFRSELNLSDADLEINVISASSGVIYNQLQHGAPFDLFLSADAARPERFAVENKTQSFPYAIGELVFWQPANPKPTKQDLIAFNGRLAIANPLLAPYGQAAIESLTAMKPNYSDQIKLIRGQNVNQAYHFVDSSNVGAGLVALSQMLTNNIHRYWLVPQQNHSLIEQRGVIVNKHNPYVQLFVEYLLSVEGQSMVSAAGYRSPASSS